MRVCQLAFFNSFFSVARNPFGNLISLSFQDLRIYYVTF